MAFVRLNRKGQEAYLSLKNVNVTLSWLSAIDLDLMAFFKAKDGRVGGVYSERYAGGSLGNLESFPFIQLNGDDYPARGCKPCEEILTIAQLEEMSEINICVINYTDAIKNQDAAFSDYNAQITIADDVGEPACIRLNSPDRGVVAVIAKIEENGFIGYKMVNKNNVMNMMTFRETVPGGHLLDLSHKQ